MPFHMNKTTPKRVPATKPREGVDITQEHFDSVPHGDHRKYGYGCPCEPCYAGYLREKKVRDGTATAALKWMKENKPRLLAHMRSEVENRIDIRSGMAPLNEGDKVVPTEKSLAKSVDFGVVVETNAKTKKCKVMWFNNDNTRSLVTIDRTSVVALKG